VATTTKRGPLAEYERKRNFDRTPEPSGKASKTKPAAKLRFVVQMHRATRLHYDFRLEADGVLKSWAVPKGPSMNPGDKRLAMMVEDHPLDYRDFEGNIPEGNYGAGSVIVWDRGTYTLLEGTSTTQQIEKGSLKFSLSGKKLHGTFALVHIKGRGGEENAWLLIKERDEYVDPKWNAEAHDESVKSGKTLADVAKDPKAKQWISHQKASRRAPSTAKMEPLPKISQPMLATLTDEPFDDPKWLYEIKWDGYRAMTTIAADGTTTMLSRNNKDLLAKFPELHDLAAAFKERPVIVDGELCVLDDEGRPSFQALQERLDRFGRRGRSTKAVTYVVFDVLYAGGRDIRDEPLEKRKAILESILTGKGPILYSKHVLGKGNALFEFAQEHGLEGVMAKRRDSIYQPRRSRDWLKIKTHKRQEVVIGGWTEPRGSRKHFGALLVGLYDRRPAQRLAYVGSVGTGFDEKRLALIAAKLAPLEREASPFDPPPKPDTKPHFVSPRLVAEVTFSEWTRDGQMRQPVFAGLREDKDPKDCVREPVTPHEDVA